MGKNKKTTSQQYENRRELPAYMTEGSQRAVQMAMDRSRESYQNYGGQRIADLSQNEQTGIAGFGEEYGRYDQDFDKARGALDSISSFTDEGVREKYMNPFVEGVLQPTARRRSRDYQSNRSELRRTAGMRGAFGGRQNVAEGLLQQGHEEGLDDLWASGYGTAFDRATSLHGQEQNRQLALAGAYGQNAQAQAGTNAQSLRNLMDSGFVERTKEQAGLDFQYLEHLEERDWDVSNLSTLVQTLAAVPSDITESGESTATEVTKDSPLKTIAAIGAITAGAIMTGGMSLAQMGGALTDIGTGMMPGKTDG